MEMNTHILSVLLQVKQYLLWQLKEKLMPNSLTNIQPLSQRINEMKKNDTNEEFFSRVRDVVEGPAYKEWLSKK